jgi:hypothetical protein
VSEPTESSLEAIENQRVDSEAPKQAAQATQAPVGSEETARVASDRKPARAPAREPKEADDTPADTAAPAGSDRSTPTAGAGAAAVDSTHAPSQAAPEADKGYRITDRKLKPVFP